ncbi:hypothetical protein HDU83_004156 [Entophlyctis luteolus]|nr:hypothetical protein HDU83_004156 [Entophlyctis luteolus]
MLTVANATSYCRLETNFTVLLYGLQVSFETSAMVTLGATSLLLAVVAGVVILKGITQKKWRWSNFNRKRRKEVFPENSPQDNYTPGGSGDTVVANTERGPKSDSNPQKRVRLQGYDGPVKGEIGAYRRTPRKTASEWLDTVLRRRSLSIFRVTPTVEGLNHDEMEEAKMKFQAPVAEAVGAFKAKAASAGGDAPWSKEKKAAEAAERQRLVEEHLRGSMELVDALREIERRKIVERE